MTVLPTKLTIVHPQQQQQQQQQQHQHQQQQQKQCHYVARGQKYLKS